MVLSNRPLRSNEVFQVRIDKMVDKWAGSIEIGVTTHNPAYLQLPSTMTNLRSGEVVEELSLGLRFAGGYLVKMIVRDWKQRRKGNSTHKMRGVLVSGNRGIEMFPGNKIRTFQGFLLKI